MRPNKLWMYASLLLLATTAAAAEEEEEHYDLELEVVADSIEDEGDDSDSVWAWAGDPFADAWFGDTTFIDISFFDGTDIERSAECADSYLGICLEFVPAYDVIDPAPIEAAEQEAVDILNYLTDPQFLEIQAGTIAITFQGDLVEALIDLNLDPTSAISQYGVMQDELLNRLYTFGLQNGTITRFPDFALPL